MKLLASPGAPAIKLYSFQALFMGSMTLSATAFPLLFERVGAIELYGVAAAAMAATGALGFLPAMLADRVGIRTVMLISLLCYGAGIATRILPHARLLVICGALIAGIGAGAALSAVRPWLALITTEASRSRILAGRENIGAAAGLLAPVILSGLTIFFSDNVSLKISLVASAIAVAFCALLVPTRLKPIGDESDEGENDVESRRPPITLSVVIFALGATGGLYTAFVNPYAIVLLASRGMTVSVASIATAILAGVRLVYVHFVGRRRNSEPFRGFIAHEMIISASTVLCGLVINPWFALCFLAIRTVGAGGSVFYEELFQAKIFPRPWLNALFGLSQSGFMGGMTVGAGLAGLLFVHIGGGSIFWISGVLTAISTIVYFVVARVWLLPLSNRDRSAVAVPQ